jgi:uncharacterized repeat protein (TIGR01451 family)
LFDPSLDSAGNGTIYPAVADEIRTGADSATFELRRPNNALVGSQTYLPGSAGGMWATFQTIVVGATPLAGTDCGAYGLTAKTSDNDDNGWRLRIRGETLAGVQFQPDFGPDNIEGSGDEAWIGLTFVSYQHLRACPESQIFYWFSDDGNADMYMLNFDMDGGGVVSYTTPSGAFIAGQVSGSSVWNDGTSAVNQQAMRPDYMEMVASGMNFDPALGDMTGDAIANPEPGLWQSRICITNPNSQYSFETPGHIVFLTEPLLPQLQISKDDGVTTTPSPGNVAYRIAIANVGAGAALPLPGGAPELTDQLPAGMALDSCTVNAPLIGSCTDASGGFISVQLDPQPGISAFLPGVNSAPNNRGTITITARILPGLGDGDVLFNTAMVDFADVYQNDYAPLVATDVDIVRGVAPVPTETPPAHVDINNTAPLITKSVDAPFAQPGDVVTWTLKITNPGVTPLVNVVVSDSLSSELEIVSALSSAGMITVSGKDVTFTQSVLQPGETATVIIVTGINDSVTVPFILQNSACMRGDQLSDPACSQSTVISVTSLPITGESHWSKWRLPVFVGGIALMSMICLGLSQFLYFKIVSKR